MFYRVPDEGHKPKRVGVEFLFQTSSVAGVLTFADFFSSLCSLKVGEVVPEIPALLQHYHLCQSRTRQDILNSCQFNMF